MAFELWNSGRKGATYNFIDRKVKEFFRISGTAAYLHLYLGPQDQGPPETAAQRVQPTITSIQDVLYMENRDRQYSDEVYELRALYNVNDVDFDLKQFGFFLNNDTLFIEFHLNDTVEKIGRKIVAGDVIELVHLRDENLLDPDAPAINKFYAVDEVNRAAGGYSPTWFPHILRVKMSPMTDTQEFASILSKPLTDSLGFEHGSLKDAMSTAGAAMGINEAVVEAARASVDKRYFETRQFYVVPGDELTSQNPWIFAGDGVPPNGAELAGTGTSFPYPATEGAYYLRSDYEPSTLFRYTSGSWKIQELDYRQAEWSAAPRILLSFLDNTNVNTLPDGSELAEKQPLYKAVKPRGDF